MHQNINWKKVESELIQVHLKEKKLYDLNVLEYFSFFFCFLTRIGLGFRPRPKDENIDSTLIWFKNGNNEDNWKYWSDSLQEFLDRMYYLSLIIS